MVNVESGEPGHAFSHVLLDRLFLAARQVLAGGSPELLREHVANIEAAVSYRESPEGQQVLRAAQQIHCWGSDGDERNIDEATLVDDDVEGGYWVMGWYYVSDEDVATPPKQFRVPVVETRKYEKIVTVNAADVDAAISKVEAGEIEDEETVRKLGSKLNTTGRPVEVPADDA